MDEPEETSAPSLKELQELGAKWIERIRLREKAEEDWNKDAEEAEAAYLSAEKCDGKDGYKQPDFNILHSNVETIVPSIYNSTPKPDIRPRHNNKDQAAKQFADLFERAISAQVDDNVLDVEIEATAQDSFLVGRGITRIKFTAEFVTDTMGMPRPTNERVLFENVSWRDYRFGPCKRFTDRPWEAFRHSISKEELDRISDKEISNVYARDEEPTKSQELDCDVWEIWCKERKKVYFVVNDSNKVIAIKDDPLGLKDFFTVPNLLQPITATNSTLPVCPYKIYKVLADELDTATDRINGIMKGLKVRGLVAGDSEAFELLAEAEDNDLIPIANIENLVAAGGIEKAVMWWPIEQAISVLQQLYLQREQTKQAIYEITGISDIIRGQGEASETATAQNIKTQWGALRIKKMQRMIERHVRDLFKLCAEVISLHFTPETIQKAAGMQIAPEMMQFLGKPFDHFRIDIESDSTVRADLTKSRQEMAQFLEGTALFMQAMAPIVAQAPGSAVPVVEMYSAFARQFNLGKTAEDALEQLSQLAQQASQNPQPNPQAEMAKAEMQMKEREFELKQAQGQQKMETDQLKAQFDILGKKLDFALKRAEFGMDMQRMEREAEVDMAKAGTAIQTLQVKAELAERQKKETSQ
jgi:hypothetical protein